MLRSGIRGRGIMDMAYRNLVFAASLLALPAAAEVVQFQGHALEVDAASGTREVLSMRSELQSIQGLPGEIVGKAQACLARPDSGMGVISVDAAAGRLQAVGRAGYRHGGQARIVKGRLAVDAGTSRVELTFTGLAEIHGEGAEEAYLPLSQQDGAGWANALAALLALEQSLLECMRR